ncbi:hypothetical protein DFH28DRAFT_1138339 [Melampsora americana]|nr:hypothetical protein DFH28DRAFT_1138339 [Melampsora americana]
MEAHEAQIALDMPFLFTSSFKLISSATSTIEFLNMGAPSFDIWDDMESSATDARSIDEDGVDVNGPNLEETKYVEEEKFEVRNHDQAKLVSSTICAMVIHWGIIKDLQVSPNSWNPHKLKDSGAGF